VNDAPLVMRLVGRLGHTALVRCCGLNCHGAGACQQRRN
jgi:hypothetical protein